MPEYWEKPLFDETRERIDSGSADFLTADELRFIGRRSDEMFIDFTRGIPGLDMEAAGTLADFARHYGTGDVPKTREDIEEFRGALDRIGGSPGLSGEYRRHVRNLSERLLNYAKTFDESPFDLQPSRLNAPIIDRSGVFGKREPDPIEESIRKSAFENFTRPDIDSLIGNVREEAKTRPFAANAPEETKQAILDDLIATFDASGLDSSWLRELKGANFLVNFHCLNDEKSNVGGKTFQQDGGFVVSMNAEKYPGYSDAMKVRLLHELRHVWQHLQETWKPKFGDGASTKTDMDVEIDAHEMQFALERILGMEAGETRKIFEAYNQHSSASLAHKNYRKGFFLFKKGYEEKGTFRLKTEKEYDEEYLE